jgi:Ca-activated chloride channel family protein
MAFLLLGGAVSLAACARPGARLDSRNQTYAELRPVRRGVKVVPPGERERVPYARERLADGAEVSIEDGGLAWLRRDGGVTLLVAGPAHFTLRADALLVDDGKFFVDTFAGGAAEVVTSLGALHLSGVRASLTAAKGEVSAYVLQGAAKCEAGVVAGPGEELRLTDGHAEKRAMLAWDDWTGGLATTDGSPAPAPFGVGTVAARSPGARGQARFALSIQKLEVRVKVDHDLAITEVDEVFFNPSPETVEGIYKFRAPNGASLHRFGVDRDGELVWGRVKEQAAAAAQYQSNVYAGSTEDPALLEWDAPGVYEARLYPIGPGRTRRVVTRYAEWLARQGARGERRLYTYPMAAEGAEASLPRIEELKFVLDLGASGARDVRTGMHGVQEGKRLLVHAYDLTPRADLAVELFDDGQQATTVTAYRARHRIEPDLLAGDDRETAETQAKAEADYVLVPVRPSAVTEPPGGLDMAVIVDTSAATDPASLAIARSATTALLAHLGKDDRAAVWASDATLRAVADGSDQMRPVDDARRHAIAAGLAKVERGGATDLGAVLADAAGRLDPARRGFVVYVGDGRPTVGELAVTDLRERLARLPHPTRLFAMGIGATADLGVLVGVARGGFAERVVDAHGAAETALRLLEAAERPVWLGVKVDLGTGVDRVYPREMTTLLADETALVVGRVTSAEPARVEVEGPAGSDARPLSTVWMADDGDLRRRWAEARLSQLLDEGAGRAAVVEVGVRYGVVTPFTSYYVPTSRELATERGRTHVNDEVADNREGGTGTRAKGEEGSMGNPGSKDANKRFGVQGPRDNVDPFAAKQAALREAAEYGMIGLLNAPADSATASTEAPAGTSKLSAAGAAFGDAFGAGGLGLTGIGEGGGGRGEGIPTGGGGRIGHGAAGDAQGLGSGHGRLGGASATLAPSMRQGALQVNGRLPEEVIQRIVRQNYGRFRLCYENGLRSNPKLSGRVSVKFVIDRSGGVTTTSDAGSDLPDQGVVACVGRGFANLSFPQPEGGIVTVLYPIVFSPGEGASASPAASRPSTGAPAASPVPFVVSKVSTVTGSIGFVVRPCDASADQPLEERVVLWRERLATAGGDVSRVAAVYRDALGRCEAPTWAERARLLSAMLDAIDSVRSRVGLWRAMFDQTAAADVLYRGILSRVHTTAQMRDLHDALGLKRIDSRLLADTLAKATTPAARVAKLRDIVQAWPDDLALALRLLEAYEDAGDTTGERILARKLRRRDDANAKVRTAVGEAYLRLAKGPHGGSDDEAEARRTFGEIVEFAPDDPVARRRLGDLLRSHGWYEEAFRQFETLARLTPDDSSVSLLLAAAAAGMGKIEEAIGWTEKAGASGAPDGSELGPLARDLAAIYLAWAEDDAIRGGRDKEAVALRERARRLSSSDLAGGQSARLFLTWTHPEVHPTLWSNARGFPAPAPRGDALLGLAVVTFSTARSDVFVEIRFEPDDAEAAVRLGAEATLTVVYGEGTDGERVVRTPVRFRQAGAVQRFHVNRDGAKEEVAR